MQVTYTGVHNDLPEKVQAKLDAKFAKLSKLLDGRGEHKAHVIVTQQKRNVRAEVTVHFYDHQFVGVGTDGDLFNAMSSALTKLDAQAVKQRERWRATHRRAKKPESVATTETERAAAAPKTRVFRISTSRRKPLTVDEAVLMIGKDSHFVFRDAKSEALSVLVRRNDGHFDLIACD
jgi:putative sigma-54 modulation protein